MDPAGLSLNALARLLGVPLEVPSPLGTPHPLAALLGQEMEALLEAVTPQGVRLRLAEGTVVTAEGSVPFPEGTRLRMRVASAGEGTGVRLQTLETRPPASPPLLAPLLEGEAQALLTRMAQATPDAPGLELFRRLWAACQEGSHPPEAQALPVEVLEAPVPWETLEKGLADLPEALREEVRTECFKAASSPRLEGKSVPSDPFRLSSLLHEHPEWPEPLKMLLGRVLAASREGRELPASLETEPASAASLERPSPSPFPRSEAGSPRPGMEGSEGRAPILSLGSPTSPRPEVPLLESLVREGVRILGDPTLSPREAPFHVAQAQERTAFFELPLPGGVAQPLQLWVAWEEDSPPKAPKQPGATPVHLLFSTRFSRLGEVRVGLKAAGDMLSVRIWSEQPDAVSQELEALTRALEETGVRVDLNVLSLPVASPDVRTLAGGRGWEGMG